MIDERERARREMARRTVLLESDVDTFGDVVEASRRYPWLVRGHVFAGELRDLAASAAMNVSQLLRLAGRPTPSPNASLDRLLDLASSENGADDLVRPGLEQGLRLLAGLPPDPTVADVAKLPRGRIDRLLWTDDVKDAEHLRRIANRLHSVPATCGVESADVKMLLTIADRLSPGP